MALLTSKSDPIDIVKIDKPEQMDYSFTFANDREKVKLIKRIEKYVRSSMEYRDCIAFLREYVGMDACAFFSNVNKETSKRIRIEIHHSPLTLFDIVAIVVEKFLATGTPLNDLLIADEVMELHYKNMVGLIPLSKTLHEVVHNSDKLTIPTYMVFGNFKEFLEYYGDCLDEDNEVLEVAYDKVDRMIEDTKLLNSSSFEALDTKITYLEVDGFTVPVKIEEEKKEEVVA